MKFLCSLKSHRILCYLPKIRRIWIFYLAKQRIFCRASFLFEKSSKFCDFQEKCWPGFGHGTTILLYDKRFHRGICSRATYWINLRWSMPFFPALTLQFLFNIFIDRVFHHAPFLLRKNSEINDFLRKFLSRTVLSNYYFALYHTFQAL